MPHDGPVVIANDRSYSSEAAFDSAPTCALELRPISPADAPGLQRGFEQLSVESRYYRFHAALRQLPEPWLERLTRVDGVDHVALVAITHHGDNTEGVGVARFVRDAVAPQRAEVAVTVVDRVQGHGVGRRLLAALAPLARERGIATFTMAVLSGNGRVRRMLALAGAVDQGSEGGVTTFVLPVRAVEGLPA